MKRFDVTFSWGDTLQQEDVGFYGVSVRYAESLWTFIGVSIDRQQILERRRAETLGSELRLVVDAAKIAMAHLESRALLSESGAAALTALQRALSVVRGVSPWEINE